MFKNKKILVGVVAVLLLIFVGVLLIFTNDINEDKFNESNLVISHSNNLKIDISGIDEELLVDELVIENKANKEVAYNLNWQDVNNEYQDQPSLAYSLVASGTGARNISDTQMPVVDLTLLEAVTIPAKAKHTYQITVKYNTASDTKDNKQSKFVGSLVVKEI